VPACQCGSTECYDAKFGDRTAGEDLRRYRRDGPDRTTRLLLDALRAEGVEGASLLDVGGGVGVIQHELMAVGVRRAVQVDAARPYIRAARQEAERRGHADRATFLHGDFVVLAAEIEPADVVTLDRVLCCHPDMEALVAASASRARRLYGIVVPRDAWWVRAGDRAANAVRQLRRDRFRTYVHAVAAIDAAARRQGLGRRVTRRTAVWEVAVYAR
jgi:magnesium-protoporphyrin O-methyltransferase